MAKLSAMCMKTLGYWRRKDEHGNQKSLLKKQQKKELKKYVSSTGKGYLEKKNDKMGNFRKS